MTLDHSLLQTVSVLQSGFDCISEAEVAICSVEGFTLTRFH